MSDRVRAVQKYSWLTGMLLALVLCGIPRPVWAEPQFIDLTHPFDASTIYWPTSKPFELHSVHKGLTGEGFWYEANNYSAAEHGGTHLDAPVHFARGKWTVDEIPLSRLVAPGILVDVSARVGDNPDTLIQRQDFLDWEQRHGRIPEGVIVLVRTGWAARWPDKKKYLGSDKPGDASQLHFPGFSEAAARFLAEDRKPAAVGLDTASLDYGRSRDFPAHQVFGKSNIPGFENLTRLTELPAKGFRVMALPMKIGQGSGAPLRIVAEIQ